MAATLYAVPASRPCACVERALQLKRIGYRRIDVPPVTQKVTSKLFVPPPVARLSAPLVARAGQRVNAATELNVRADLAHLEGHLARVDRWIDHEVIGGEAPNAADLQIGAGLRLLLTVEDVAAFAGSRPATELARKWFPDYPGHTPAGMLPAGWLPSSE